ncbi:hypothetical protein SRHO_G00252800 [Serrasalmus rhombeus]
MSQQGCDVTNEVAESGFGPESWGESCTSSTSENSHKRSEVQEATQVGSAWLLAELLPVRTKFCHHHAVSQLTPPGGEQLKSAAIWLPTDVSPAGFDGGKESSGSPQVSLRSPALQAAVTALTKTCQA